jgi:hypothetical protein
MMAQTSFVCHISVTDRSLPLSTVRGLMAVTD